MVMKSRKQVREPRTILKTWEPPILIERSDKHIHKKKIKGEKQKQKFLESFAKPAFYSTKSRVSLGDTTGLQESLQNNMNLGG